MTAPENSRKKEYLLGKDYLRIAIKKEKKCLALQSRITAPEKKYENFGWFDSCYNLIDDSFDKWPNYIHLQICRERCNKKQKNKIPIKIRKK